VSLSRIGHGRRSVEASGKAPGRVGFVKRS